MGRRPAERAFVQPALEEPRTADNYERPSNRAAADPILNRRQRIVALHGGTSMWSYLRIEHVDPTGAKPWLHNTAGVGNTRTNLCEIIMKMVSAMT